MGHLLVDLDRTLAYYESGDYQTHGPLYIGKPVEKMVQRVKGEIRKGREVKIFTARAAEEDSSLREAIINAIHEWCRDVFGFCLEVTCVKDWQADEIWDDLAKQVIPNTGDFIE